MRFFSKQLLIRCALLPLFLTLSGCQSAYYATMETFGIEKREILVDRVGEAREAQDLASEQFESALEEFTALTTFDGGDLQRQYNRLKKELDKSSSRAEQVRDKIKSVEKVAKALFKEWESEIDQYTDDYYKVRSQANLTRTRERYGKLLAAMQNSEGRIKPVLDAFTNRVLFLKHNLNAQALTSLKGDAGIIESDVRALLADIQRSMREADAFINDMK